MYTMYNTGERSEPEKNKNKIKTTFGPPLLSTQDPTSDKFQGGGGSGPPPPPLWIRECRLHVSHTAPI